VVSVRDDSKRLVPIESSVEARGGRDLPEWLEANTKTLQGRLVRLPSRETIPVNVQENLIVELYSK
jgi:small subunit ribosomal protein S4